MYAAKYVCLYVFYCVVGIRQLLYKSTPERRKHQILAHPRGASRPYRVVYLRPRARSNLRPVERTRGLALCKHKARSKSAEAILSAMDRQTKVSHSLAGVLRAAEQNGVRASGAENGELVESDHLTASLLAS